MATATARSFDVATLEGLEAGPEHDGRIPLNIRRHFDIQGFGVRANRAVGDGHVIGEHDEVGLGASGQEELYLVISGAATFNIDGERVEAPAGTLVFVRNPAAKRSAVAKEEGTTVLAIGGTPGEAYRISSGEAMNEMWEPYRAGDYETALEKLQPVLQERPEALVYFNVACMEARLGRSDDAIAHLQQAIEDDDRIKENIRTDEDLDSIRDDPRFAALAA
jgi:tetratricopeptide (TPR) repeat protein